LAATVAQGIKVGSWNTKPMRRGPAARRLAQAGDDAQGRRLAAARRAEQRDELARPHVEVEAVECDHAVGEGLADAVERDDGSAE
jgi:hypothetical protein